MTDSSNDDDGLDDEKAEIPAHLRGARRVIAIGGGRGGVGKSLVAQNLAVYFAQLGKSVILVDLDPTGANLHAQFGVRAGAEPPTDDTAAELSRSLIVTSVPGLSILPGPHDAI